MGRGRASFEDLGVANRQMRELQHMRGPSPGEIERSLVRVAELQAELGRAERAIGRRVQFLAKSLARLMEPGDHFHRSGVGLHAFHVRGETCLAAAYLEPDGDDFRYRYVVLCGGEAATQALRDAALGPGDSDEPGPRRRIALASYNEYEDFVDRLPKYIGDVARRVEDRLRQIETTDDGVRAARKLIAPVRSKERQT
jgi:hypothetical protein